MTSTIQIVATLILAVAWISLEIWYRYTPKADLGCREWAEEEDEEEDEEEQKARSEMGSGSGGSDSSLSGRKLRNVDRKDGHTGSARS